MPSQKHKKCKRYDNESDAHHLTFSCYHGLPLLSKPRSQQWMLDALTLGRERHLYDLWAYVIMPEHVHLILWPEKDITISQILTLIKQSVSRKAMLWLNENSPEFLEQLKDIQPNGKKSYRFWQRGGGYDRNLRSVADIHEKIEYVHQNPVRRELVSKPQDWYFSSCQAWLTGSDQPIALDRESVPMLMSTDEK